MIDDTLIRRMFDYDRRLLPNRYLAEVEKQYGNLQEALPLSGLTIGYPAWNLLYYVLLCTLPSQQDEVYIIETGTGYGFSTIILAQALRDRDLLCRIHSVDSDPRASEYARDNLSKAGLSNYVELHTEDSLTFLERFTREVRRIDFAFLDGNHASKHVFKEFALIHPKLTAPSSTVYFDNTSGHEVGPALKSIQEQFGGNMLEFPNCSWGPPGNAVWQPDRVGI